ncbi:TPM domain-containing protein [Biformimicrobium ophioploci]|uniref:TPM domain-containing protein n=1 Tax=Biformimicrobium ophioploci TaxID=3036711 RepID=A0ABQ6LZS0_9GAMM|nr:hypothetical protein [Microbulbifer sp. NKW57]GMG87572.1 TPM domain-containing protein [Microbulbifer sp. NKW57]
MAFFDKPFCERVADTIREAEQQTDAEIVTVLAHRADSYYYIPALWAAVIALLSAPLLRLLPFWIEDWEQILLQWLIFIVLSLVFRWQPILMHLIPRSVKYWRAESLARRQFLEQELHHTEGRLGLLIFVSEAEHYVEIMADQGLAEHIKNERWQKIVEDLILAIHENRTDSGFIRCIEQCGELLREAAPLTHEKNELPNHLVIL